MPRSDPECRASLRAAARVGRTRRSVTSVPEEWPSPPPAVGPGARRRISRVLSRPEQASGAAIAIPLRRPSPSASCDRPERRRGGSPGTSDYSGVPATPIWSCSRWGFPCRRRCRRRGALLPHRFTLAARPACRRQAGGVLSVALSLGSPPPGVTRHRASVEPGLSSPRASAESGHPTVWHGKIWAAMGLCQSPR